MAELTLYRNGGPSRAGVDRITPGTIADLVSRYFQSSDFNNGGAMTQRKNRGILKAFRNAHGDKTVRNANFENIDRILAAKSETHPAAARNLRKQLKRLFALSILIKMRLDNPVDGVRLAIRKIGPDEEAGFHTWSGAEIEQYQTFHPLGSKERLAMELMLWTGCRRGDVIRLGRQNLQNGRLSFTQRKTGKAMVIALSPQLRAAIEAVPQPT